VEDALLKRLLRGISLDKNAVFIYNDHVFIDQKTKRGGGRA
jgi:hypothetical protein